MNYIRLTAIPFYLLLMLGCGHGGSSDQPHEHEGEATQACANPAHNHTEEQAGEDTHGDELQNHTHEAVKQLITAYSRDFEVFAEADPFIKGQKAKVLAHFTRLTDFKPLAGGTLTVTLTVGANSESWHIEPIARPGIFEFTLTPPFPGTGQITFTIDDGMSQYKVIAGGLTIYEDEHEALHAAETAQVHNPNAIVFTKEQSWRIDFATELLVSGPFGQTIRTSGHIRPAPTDEAIITSKSSGVVNFMDDKIVAGAFVEAGQALVRIAAADFVDNNSRVRYAEAQNSYENAKAIYERNLELFKDKIVSERELQQSKTEYGNARAVFENLKQHFDANGQNVVSPSKGTIREVYVTHGQHVEAGQPLLSVSKNRSLLIEAGVQQKYVPQLRDFVSASIRLVDRDVTYSLDRLNGKLLSYGKSTTTNSYLIPVNFQVDYAEGLLPGSFVELFISTRSGRNCISVPNTALMEEQGYYSVFVQLTPELFEKRGVTIGSTDGIRTEIKNGLAEGERIVTRGALLVKLAAVSNSLDPHAGHVH
jgi:RND family efflux transporter MFP subunit